MTSSNKTVTAPLESDSDSDSEQDMMTFLKKMKKEQKKALSAISSKIKEVVDIVEPLKERMDAADLERGKNTADIIDMRENISGIRECIKKLTEDKAKENVPAAISNTNSETSVVPSGSSFPSLQVASNTSTIFQTSRTEGPALKKKENDELFKRETVLERAGKVISLFPVLRGEVEEIEKELKKEGFDDKDQKALRKEALTKAAFEYLHLELKIPKDHYDKLNIKRIFTGAVEDWRTIYLELHDKDQADWVLSHAGNLNPGILNIGNHVPWQARARHEAFQSQAHKLRKEEGMRTKIVIDKDEYVLQYRSKSSRDPWSEWRGDQDTPSISDSRPQAGQIQTPSKGKGRVLRVELTNLTLKRALSPESATVNKANKRPKQTGAPEEEPEEEEEVEEISMSNGGVFTSVEYVGNVRGRRQSNIHEFADNVPEGEKMSEVMTNTNQRPQRKTSTKK